MLMVIRFFPVLRESGVKVKCLVVVNRLVKSRLNFDLFLYLQNKKMINHRYSALILVLKK